ncbi:hypothetical protein [Desulfatirhabdium butyrativorans]|uniref:hypothetical protein n=1 Tax=Desulfatirhabdium butyrativorans TaxID=340467 RepID=UPI0004295F9F|nr:hypothetical protein [Desulfatirhabdium butyrativorans]
MKKRIVVTGISVFLILAWSQISFANITLNVNSRGNTAANKITYTSGTTTKTVTLPWKEKAVYSGGEVGISVKNAVKGDIIIKVDIVDCTSAANTTSVSTVWMKYGTVNGPLGPVKNVELVQNTKTASGDTVAVDKTDLTTLYLAKAVAANTTTNLLNFVTDWNFAGQITFTALLVDDVASATPQVLGVDIQSILFNGSDDGSGTTASPIWFKLIQSGN